MEVAGDEKSGGGPHEVNTAGEPSLGDDDAHLQAHVLQRPKDVCDSSTLFIYLCKLLRIKLVE